MTSIKSIFKYLKNPYALFDRLSNDKNRNLPNMDDVTYLKWKFRGRMGYKLNLENPITYNEKLQWIKLYDHRDFYTQLVDKYMVKFYVINKIGDFYVIPTIGIWDSVDDIEFNKLSQCFVLKCTHDSGGVIICQDKSKFDIEKAKQKLFWCLQRNFFYYGREWPYKNVKPRIIAEKFIDLDTENSAEYKFFCFDGIVRYVLVCKGKAHILGSRTNDFYDVEFNHLPLKVLNENANKKPERPEQYDEMIRIAEKLSSGIPHVRVDLYLTQERIYFGEMTFFHNSGLRKFEPKEYDKIWGEWFKLPEKTL